MSGKTLLRRGCLALLLGAFVLAALLAFGWWRARSTPEVWKQQEALLETRSGPERKDLARRAEERLRQAAREVSSSPSAPRISQGSGFGVEGAAPPAALGRPRPPRSKEKKPRRRDGGAGSRDSGRLSQDSAEDETHRVTLHLDEINALLQERVVHWEAQRRRSPLPIKNPILAIEGDHLVLFVQLLNRGSEMLLALPVDIAIDDRGGVARLLGVRLGQLPLPGLEALPRLLRSTGDPGLAELAQDAEAAATGYPFDPILETENGAPLRIIGLEVDGEQQALHLTVGPG